MLTFCPQSFAGFQEEPDGDCEEADGPCGQGGGLHVPGRAPGQDPGDLLPEQLPVHHQL